MSRTTIDKLKQGKGTVVRLVRLLAVLAPNARRRASERAYWGKSDKEDRDNHFMLDRSSKRKLHL